MIVSQEKESITEGAGLGQIHILSSWTMPVFRRKFHYENTNEIIQLGLKYCNMCAKLHSHHIGINRAALAKRGSLGIDLTYMMNEQEHKLRLAFSKSMKEYPTFRLSKLHTISRHNEGNTGPLYSDDLGFLQPTVL